MNSTITQFNFKNTPRLKKLYIDPNTEVKGSINLSKTPIEWTKLDDETKYKEESILGIIYTSNTIFNNHIKLVSSKKELEKTQTIIEQLYIELKNKSDVISITGDELTEKIKLLEQLQEERTLSEQQKKEAWVEKENLLKEIQELTKSLKETKEGEKKAKDLEDLLPNDTEKKLIGYLSKSTDELLKYKDELTTGKSSWLNIFTSSIDWTKLRGHFVEVRKNLINLLEKLENTKKTLEEKNTQLGKERKEHAIEINKLQDKNKEVLTDIEKQLVKDFISLLEGDWRNQFENKWKIISKKIDENLTPNLNNIGLGKEDLSKVVNNILKDIKEIKDKTDETERMKGDYSKLQVQLKEGEVKLSSKEKEIQTHLAKIKELGGTNTRDISSLQNIIKQKDLEIARQQQTIKDLEARINSKDKENATLRSKSIDNYYYVNTFLVKDIITDKDNVSRGSWKWLSNINIKQYPFPSLNYGKEQEVNQKNHPIVVGSYLTEERQNVARQFFLVRGSYYGFYISPEQLNSPKITYLLGNQYFEKDSEPSKSYWGNLGYNGLYEYKKEKEVDFRKK